MDDVVADESHDLVAHRELRGVDSHGDDHIRDVLAGNRRKDRFDHLGHLTGDQLPVGRVHPGSTDPGTSRGSATSRTLTARGAAGSGVKVV